MTAEKLERIKMIIESLDSVTMEEENYTRLDRFLTLVGCLVGECKSVIDENESKYKSN